LVLRFFVGTAVLVSARWIHVSVAL
jgi:hypothetical protein